MTPESFILLDESLAVKLFDTWQPIKHRIIADIIKAVSNDDYAAVTAAVTRIKLERAVDGNHEYIKLIGRGAVRFGASRLTNGDPSKTEAVEEPGTKETIKKSASQVRMLLKDASIKVRRRVEGLALDELENRRIGKMQKDITTLAEGLGGKFATGESSINLAASLHTSRLATYGYCVEATLLQLTTAVINEVLDVRTCPVCELMDGTVINVSKTFATVKKAFEAKTVEELKRAVPWPGQSKADVDALSKLTTTEKQNLGYMPPFHPLCRGFLDENKTGTTVIDEVVTPSNIPGMGDILPPSIEQSEQVIRNSVIPRSGSVSLEGIEDLSTANQIAESLARNVEQYGLMFNTVDTVPSGNFLTRMNYDPDTNVYAYLINTSALNNIGDKQTIDAVISAGADDGLHLARNLDDTVTHDYGERVVIKQALARGDLETTYDGLSELADQGLIESGGELFLKRSVSSLNAEETEFLDGLL